VWWHGDAGEAGGRVQVAGAGFVDDARQAMLAGGSVGKQPVQFAFLERRRLRST